MDIEKEKELAASSAAVAAAYDDDEEEDDEADFDPYAANSDDDDDDDNSEDDDDNEEDGTKDHVVLNGTIHLNDDGRVIYSGTWSLQSEMDSYLSFVSPNSKPRKPPKFKLKSQDVCYPPRSSSSSACPQQKSSDGGNGNDNGNGKGKSRSKSSMVLFDIHRPTLAKEPPAAVTGAGDEDKSSITALTIPTRRTMIFDGFFFEPLPPPTTADHGNHGKKIKERDVEVFFTTVENENSSPSSSAVAYRISGRGYNDYGPFVLDGTYNPPPQSTVSNEDKEGQQQQQRRSCAKVECNKSYGSGGMTKATRSTSGSGGGAAIANNGKRSRRNRDDGMYDEDFDEKADHHEVNELCMDAGLSIEELRRKYYGGGGGGDEEESGDGGGKVVAKRPRLDSSDDDECGF
mmetsp:Transcript_20437/g.44356  ORF Transcript_20437/g.44356 Transcript_20437/m.44356 type:complete len:402 (+) Transcript_20437:174-1379(+)|eukprot:CAMPEP_0172313866 /NCGR_PEP_ID=MMETSP1058-20130122/21156_1 /TAXON_ID=83371 /ORGANISM="Detonula confervacea, Strain CCMP 353" /LENGTH=401 /DNA_ID=CAMNT_0013027591 /DNA_START=111 /DNA_END=1316 /DNA_ORIENTATION=+